MNSNDFSFLKVENIFVAFLYSDSKEHLIYLENGNPFDKIYDLITGCEIAFSDIDRYSVRKYYHNQINYDNIKYRYFTDFESIARCVRENVDIKLPIFKTRNNFVKNYIHDRNQLIDLKNYRFMTKKYKRFVEHVGHLNYYKELTYSIGLYLKISEEYYYDMFSQELLRNEKDTLAGFDYYYLIKENCDIRQYFCGNVVRKNELINETYKLIKK